VEAEFRGVKKEQKYKLQQQEVRSPVAVKELSCPAWKKAERIKK